MSDDAPGAASCHTDHGEARLHFLDSGGDDLGAPIIFVPGMTDTADDYREVLPAFGRRTVVLDLRGHGRSSAPSAGYDFATLRGDVGAVVDAVTDGDVHLVTFSRGTTYGVGWAVANPHRVRSVSIGDYVPEEKVLTGGQADRLLAGRWRGSPVSDRLDVRAAQLTFEAARPQSMWTALARLDVALLAVRSGGSFLVGDDDWARYRELFPDAELVEFGESPHDIFRPDRARFPTLVRRLVERAEARHR